MCVRAPRGTHHVWSQAPSLCAASTNLEDGGVLVFFICCFGNSRCLGSVTCQNGQKIHQNEIWVSNHGRLCTQGALNSWPTLLCLTHRDTGCSCASLPQQCSGGPHPWERTHRAGFPPILTSASALYQPHTMGLGTTPGQPPPPGSTLLGNGLFLPLLGVGWGHLQEGPVVVGSSDPVSAFRQNRKPQH